MTTAIARASDDRLDAVLIGQSLVMQRLRTRISQLAPLGVSVLLTGPTGAGKELVARALHAASGRRGDFVGVNVCAIPEPMFEDTLFGHVRGAFTGAVCNRRGSLAEADGGTLFLDEIGDLSLTGQVKLLRAIDLGLFRPIGAQRDEQSQFRTVAATNADIERLVRSGGLRQDLYYRIGGARLQVPSLAERLDDIPDLAHYFARAACLGQNVEIAPRALAMLQTHAWPGNVRELRHVVECAVGQAPEKGKLSAYDVAFALDSHQASIDAGSVDAADTNRSFRSYTGDVGELRLALAGVMSEEHGNIVAVAMRFRVAQSTIYRWLRALGLPTPHYTRSKMQGNAAGARMMRRQGREASGVELR